VPIVLQGYPDASLMRNALLGIVIAAALAVSVSNATLFGIDAWKIVLAGFGLVVFVVGGSGGRRRRA